MNRSLIRKIEAAIESGDGLNPVSEQELTNCLYRLYDGKHLTPYQAGLWGGYVQRFKRG